MARGGAAGAAGATREALVVSGAGAQRRTRESTERLIHFEPGGPFARTPLREVRRSLQALQPEPLEGSRLPDAIAEMARGCSEISSVALSFGTTGRPVPLLTEPEVALFRVAQEALANVAKHSSASRVDLKISYTDDLCCSACGPMVSALPGAGTALSASVQAICYGRRRMSASGAIRLLIVDDHPMVRDGLRGIFAVEAGFEVVGRGPAEAVTRAKEVQPDVVLMDLRMPGKTPHVTNWFWRCGRRSGESRCCRRRLRAA